MTAQPIGYGVNANGQLFRFSLTSPNDAVTNIGNLGFVPEGIDFRPTTTPGDVSRTLYAIDVGTGTTQLYTVSTIDGSATPVGAGFPSVVSDSYNLVTATSFGFDFNPGTLQEDGSIRIRLVSNSGVNLRLNSDTGLVAAVDTPLAYVGSGDAASVDAVAYINSDVAVMAGTTSLFDMDYRTDQLSRQDPPNGGTLNPIGPYGLTIDSLPNVHFDILTAVGSADTTIGGDTGYAVLKRPDAPIGGPFEQWLLYNVNLGTGGISNGALVGVSGGNPSADFTGGMAVLIPEPNAMTLSLLAATGCLLAGPRRFVRCLRRTPSLE